MQRILIRGSNAFTRGIGVVPSVAGVHDYARLKKLRNQRRRVIMNRGAQVKRGQPFQKRPVR